MTIHNKFMRLALKESEKAFKADEVPIGAILVYQNKIIARAYNKIEKTHDATAHAEIQVIQKASKKLKSWRLNDMILYVTCEPCIMCAGAIVHARISHVYFGCKDKRWGSFYSINDFSKKFNHRVTISGGILEEEAKKLLQNFFKRNRYQSI